MNVDGVIKTFVKLRSNGPRNPVEMCISGRLVMKNSEDLGNQLSQYVENVRFRIFILALIEDIHHNHS